MKSFERSSIRPFFPVLNPALFEEAMRLAYNQPGSHLKNLTVRACTLAFLAFANLLEIDSPLGPRPDTNKNIEQVESLIPIIFQTNYANAIQACVIPLLIQVFTDSMKSAAFTNSITASLLF